MHRQQHPAGQRSQYRRGQRIEIESTELTNFRVSTPARALRDFGGEIALDPFRSHELLDALNGASTALSLPINELVFRLDDNPMHPYLRYIATVKLFGGYPAMRKFLAAVRTPLPNTSLDAISCTRTDIRSIHVSCELTVSAFYRHDPHA